MKQRTTIGITMGDPAGVGPEILVKALASLRGSEAVRSFDVIVIGDRAIVEHEVRKQKTDLRLGNLDDGQVTDAQVVDLGVTRAQPIQPGAISGEAGRLSYLAIERGVELAIAKRIDALVTCPVSKEAINLAGIPFVGHTETIAKMTGTSGTVMMLAHGNVRVTHLSTHVPLSMVPSLLTPQRLRRVLDLTINALHDLGITRPRIAVAALNPHAGENGLFGTEDGEISAKVIAEYVRAPAEVTGPHPADTIFVKAVAGYFDAIVAMYHDQGHIPLKLLGFKIDPTTKKWVGLSGINVTLGLPIIRTSVDHGTAFDIAGRGIANAQSLLEAVGYARDMAAHQRKAAGVP